MEPLENNACLTESEQKIINEVREAQEESRIKEQKQSENALNEIALAVVFTLFQVSKSPVLPVLKKMEEYQNFNTFLGNALQSSIDEFIPEIGYSQDHRETMREEEKRNV